MCACLPAHAVGVVPLDSLCSPANRRHARRNRHTTARKRVESCSLRKRGETHTHTHAGTREAEELPLPFPFAWRVWLVRGCKRVGASELERAANSMTEAANRRGRQCPNPRHRRRATATGTDTANPPIAIAHAPPHHACPLRRAASASWWMEMLQRQAPIAAHHIPRSALNCRRGSRWSTTPLNPRDFDVAFQKDASCPDHSPGPLETGPHAQHHEGRPVGTCRRRRRRRGGRLQVCRHPRRGY